MSTIAPRRSPRRRIAAVDETSRKPKSLWRLRFKALAIMCAAVALAVWFIPALVAHTPLAGVLLSKAVGGLPCRVSAGGVSLGWWSPVVLTDVRLTDHDGSELLAVGVIRTEKQLLRLLLSGEDVGTAHIQQPVLHVDFDREGSNLERLLSDYLAADRSAAQPSLTLIIEGGTVVVEDRVKSRQWRIEDVELSAHLPGGTPRPTALSCAGRVTGAERSGGFTWELARELDSQCSIEMKMQATGDALPVALIEPLLRRMSGFEDVELGGNLTTDLTCTWTGHQPEGRHLTLSGQLDVERLACACAWLGEDRLELRQLHVPLNIRRQHGQWHVEECAVRCDLGQFSAHGTIAMPDVPSGDKWSTWTAALTAGDYELSGRLDLARLAKMLPRTVRVRQSTNVRSGEIDLFAKSRQTTGGWSWEGRLDASNLEATVRGAPVVWRQPIRVSAALRGDWAGAVIDRLRCESEFLQIDGHGNLDALDVSAQYNLEKLAEELNRFIDLGQIQLRGHGHTTASWRRGAERRFQTNLHCQLRELVVALPGMEAWREAHLEWTGTAAGVADGAGVDKLETAALNVRAADGQLDVHLTRAVKTPTWDATWPVEIGLEGRLQGWRSRLTPWTGPLTGWETDGVGRLSATLVIGPEQIDVETSKLTVKNLMIQSAGSAPWQEPQLTVAVRCRWDRAADALEVEQMECRGQSLAVEMSGRVAALTGTRDVQIKGAADFDLAKLQPIIESRLGRGLRLAGRDTCRFEVSGPLAELSVQQQGGLSAKADAAWQSADFYGVRLGPAKVAARLEAGRLNIDPLAIAVSEGHLHLRPSVDLTPGPAVLRLAPGTLIENVRITPEMCDGALEYVAPVLAGVTAAEGRFSVSLDDCHVPLADAKRGDVSGHLTVHSVQVGPGPLVRELAILLNHAAPAKLSKESRVTFRMVEGRVYHRDLVMEFPDLTVRTYGSVGLDRTLAIMAEMPVPPKWVGDDSLGRAVKNRTIRLPIGGTLDAPRIDRRELDRVAAEFVRDTAVDALNNELGRQLDKLFRP